MFKVRFASLITAVLCCFLMISPLVPQQALAADVTVTPTEIPISSAEILNPLRGWFNPGGNGIPVDSYDDYERINWIDLEPTEAATEEDYDLSPIETLLSNAANSTPKRKAAIRIRTYAGKGVKMPQYMIDDLQKGFFYDYDKDGDVNLYHEYDVTSFVSGELAGDDTASFIVAVTDNLDVSFNSNNASANKPVLEVIAGGNIYPITASADAYVRNGSANENTNYGTSNEIHLKDGGDGFNRIGYLKFDLSGVPASSATKATLKLYCKDVDSTTTVQVSSTSDAWTETGITWSNKPSAVSLLTSDSIGDHGTKETYIPDWNDPIFLDRANKLLQAIGHAYDGDPRLAWVDIGMYGNFGEWHNNPINYATDAYSGATEATLATMQDIVDMHVNAFPTTRLVMMTSKDDALQYALGKSTRIGWRRDSLGSTIFDGINPTTILDRWKTAPVVTEPIFPVPSGSGIPARLKQQVQDYHAANINNINITYANMTQAEKDDLVMAGILSGYRFVLSSVTFPSSAAANASINVSADWENAGVTPLYEPFNVKYRLRDSTTGSVVWEGTSSLDLQTLLPTGGTPATVNDTFNLTSLSPGTYTFDLIVEDEAGYRLPLALAIEGRQTDGSYPLGTMTVSQSSTTHTFNPAADAFVRSGTPTQNYGTSADLYEKNGGANFIRYGYLKFDLSNYTGGSVSDAQLKLYAKTLGASSGVKVYSVTDDSWTETGLNWNNKPAKVTELDNVTVSSTGTTYSFDVTSFVNSEVAAGHQIVSLYLEALAPDTDVIFDSREGSHPPVLDISN